MVQLYIYDIKSLPKDFECLIKKFSNKQYEKIAKLKNDDDKLRSLAGILMLCKVFNIKHNKLEVCYDKNQKPFLPNYPQYNISHSGEYVLLAVGNNPIGCDIEKHTKRDFKSIANYFFTKEEQLWFSSQKNNKSAFFKLWTLKESYIKSTGEGLKAGGKNFCIDIKNSINVININPKGNKSNINEEKKYIFKTFDSIQNYSIAVCSQNECICDEIKTINI